MKELIVEKLYFIWNLRLQDLFVRLFLHTLKLHRVFCCRKETVIQKLFIMQRVSSDPQISGYWISFHKSVTAAKRFIFHALWSKRKKLRFVRESENSCCIKNFFYKGPPSYKNTISVLGAHFTGSDGLCPHELRKRLFDFLRLWHSHL